ncbi:MAG: hypothetical protein H7Y36_01400 [Armatimonadetes bacterium]|nr:hypothetical protein [Akkermansiaceae bacterium]
MLAEPQKELRFTRSGQAVIFCVVGAMFVGLGVTLLATGVHRETNPELPDPVWAVPCFLLTAAAFWMAWHLTKHAYLILTPIGLEIFPFFRPARRMQLVMWQEIVEADVDEKESWLTLHFNAGKSAGMHVSLKPIRKNLRSLLAKAVLGRVSGGNA